MERRETLNLLSKVSVCVWFSDLNVGSLADAEAVIAKLKGELSELTSELSRKSEDVDRVSGDLCRLRNRLLEDGMFKYLEKV